MSIRRKVIVIGLDGLTLQMLLPLVDQGQLPHFARLLATGAHGTLQSVTNLTTGPTWASFATGCLPHHHGILHDFHHLPAAYQLQPTKGSDCRRPFFWQLAGAADRRVVVLNVPMSYPVQPLNGVILAGIDAPSERAPGFAYPDHLYTELRRQGIDYLIDCGLASYIQRGHLAAGRQAVARETEGRTRAAEYLLTREAWDLFVVVYSLPDVWQHYYWGAPPGSAGDAQMREGYHLLDQHVGRLLAHLPEDGLVILCSDHGFGPLTGTRDHLNQWLAQQGFLHYLPAAQPTTHTATRAVSRLLLSSLRRLVSFRRRQQLLATLPALRRLVETRLRIGGIDWRRTQVYAALDHLELWINRQGRQPEGCVAPDAYEQVCAQVTTALLDWRDEQRGTPYLTKVERNVFPTSPANANLAPDLLLTWNPAVINPHLHPLITGDHTPDGAIIVAGPGVQPGGQLTASLCDIAPIVLHGLGLSLSTAMDGSVPAGLFKG
ncbi:MAG: alkaline phosphatase family protein [Caldilineaceae bacterium]